MIQRQTILDIVDNTGAKKLMCIGIPGSNKKEAELGDLIIGVVKKATPNMKIKQSQVVKAIIVRVKKKINRFEIGKILFSTNAAVIVNDEINPIGTRIFGCIAQEIKNKKYSKIVAISEKIL